MRIVPAAGVAALLLVFTLPVLATTQAGPFAVTVTTSPNPYAIEGTTWVNGSSGILAIASGTSDAALQGYAQGQGSTGLEGFASSSSGTLSNGVYGYAANGFGVYGQAKSVSDAGVVGLDLDGSGGTGVVGKGASMGVYGAATSQIDSAEDYGVFGIDQTKYGGYGVGGESAAGIGVTGFATTTGIGVYGTAGSGTGVDGNSQSSNGVAGVTVDTVNASTLFSGAIGNSAGVSGLDDSDSASVTGDAGVSGTSTYGTGVVGTSEFGPNGVYGSSTDFQGVSGRSTSGMGVTGGSGSGPGVFGYSDTNVGVDGVSKTGIGLAASTTSTSPAADINQEGSGDVIRANSGSNTVMSLDTSGNMILSGGLTQKGTPASTVRDANGAERVAYSQRATQATIEDLGRAQMVRGRAEVRLDPTFASTLADTDYLVFLTARGDSNALYVTNSSLGGFEIREHGGTSTLAIDYRIVGRPRPERPEPRLAVLPPQRISPSEQKLIRAEHDLVRLVRVDRAADAMMRERFARLAARMRSHPIALAKRPVRQPKPPVPPHIPELRPGDYGPRLPR